MLMTRVTVEIPPARAALIAKIFQDEDLEVSWETQFETRAGGGLEAVQVVYFLAMSAGAGIVGGASYDAVKRAINKLRERFPALEVTVDDEQVAEEQHTD